MTAVLGLLETTGLAASLVAIDLMEKTSGVRLLQCELNDYYGVVSKIEGPLAAVIAAIEAGRAAAEHMRGQPITTIIPRADDQAMRAIVSTCEFSPLIDQDVVFIPTDPASRVASPSPTRDPAMNRDQGPPFALGLIETQGFTAVFEAIDTACKAASVEVVGKEKLGGGFVTVIIRGDLSAVTAAIEAGQAKVEGLGKLIAAHVIARPSPAVLGLLPR